MDPALAVGLIALLVRKFFISISSRSLILENGLMIYKTDIEVLDSAN